MPKVNLPNLENTLRFVAGLPKEKLGGLGDTVLAKAKELGVTPKAAKFTPGEATGHVRGVLRFVESLDETATADDKAKLAALAAVLQGKLAPKKGKAALRREAKRKARRKAK